MRSAFLPLGSLKAVAAFAAAALAVSGCGQAKPKGPPPPSGLFTDAQDCASANKAPLEDCKKAIADAIAVHEKSATFLSERLCDNASGPGRCERLSTDKWRPRLAAFHVEFSKPVKAQPLYGPKKTDVIGYVTTNNAKTFKTVDETLIVTASAKRIAYSFVDPKKIKQAEKDALKSK